MEERLRWNANHEQHRYSDVFSILDDKIVREKFIDYLMEFRGAELSDAKILIPGCGSNSTLQNLCQRILGLGVAITAVDWSEAAIKQAKENSIDLSNVDYLCSDARRLESEDGTYDVVLMSNAIVGESAESNFAYLAEMTRILKVGGSIAGVIPCAFGMLDYALTSGLANHWLSDGTIDIESKTVYEQSQGLRQRFFTPLELKVACLDLSLKLKGLEVLFFSSPDFSSQMVRLYKTQYSDRYCLWGTFFKAVKVSS